MTENELRGEIRHCDNELKKFRHQMEKLKRKAMQVESKREACRNSLKDLENTPKNIEISNHAFVRYFERVLGFDLAKVSLKFAYCSLSLRIGFEFFEFEKS